MPTTFEPSLAGRHLTRVRTNMPATDTMILAAARVIGAKCRTTDAVVLNGGGIVATGPRGEMRERFPTAQFEDLGAGVLSAGFVDAHMHPYAMLNAIGNLDLSPTVLGDRDALSALRAHAVSVRARRGGWVIAVGYDDVRSGRVDRRVLDAIVSDLPVFVWHFTAHLGIFNSAALAALGIDEETASKDDSFGRDDGGRLDGLVRESALFSLTRHRIPFSDDERRRSSLATVSAQLAAAGVTTVVDAGAQPSHIALYRSGRADGTWSQRCGYLLTTENMDAVESGALPVDRADARLRMLGFKAFADGSLGARTCVTREPLDEGGRAMPLLDRTQLRALVERAIRMDSVLAVHANGDATIELLLDVIDDIGGEQAGTHVRLEHASILDAGLIARIARADVAVVPLTGYLADVGGRLIDWYGARRTEHMFAFRSLREANVRIGASSDALSGPYEPLAGISAMVNRRGYDGRLVGGEEAVDVNTAIDIYTAGSATVSGWGDTIGTIAAGYRADLIILEGDPMAVPKDEIRRLQVLRTYIDGEVVHAV